MERILISILSEHLIPNYLYIKEFPDSFDKLVFVTTDAVENRGASAHLEGALALPVGSVRRVAISHENFAESMAKLEAEQFSSDAEYCVNVTGGTKAMSIAVHSFFARFNARFVYIAEGRNMFFDFATGQGTAINYRMNLQEYLALYGMSCDYYNETLFGPARAYDAFNRMRMVNFQPSRVDNIKNAQALPTPEERKWWGGEWFEEYSYLRIKQQLHLPDDAIGFSVRIFRGNTPAHDNELDVAFVHDNRFHVVECKVGMTGYGRDVHVTVSEYLYKLAAVAKDLGLRVNSYLFTLHNMQRLNTESLNKRCRILGIKGIYSSPEFTQPTLNL